jgi:hypothetical protein
MTLVLGLATLAGRRIRTVQAGLSVLTLTACLLGAWSAGPDFGWTERTYPSIWWNGLRRNALLLMHPRSYFEALLGEVQKERVNHALPRTKEIVGSSPIDIFDWEEGVLFLNGFHWRPRPVLHSYMTYTPQLVKRNGDFLRSDRAPEFALFKLEPVRRDFWPTMADAEALDVLMHGYEPVLTERDYLLLRRAKAQGLTLVTEREPVLQLSAQVGRKLDLPALPAGDLYLAVNLPLTHAGALLNALYKPPAVSLEVSYDDGTNLRGRIVPGMVERGILISPAIRTTEAVRQHYQDGLAGAATALTIDVLGWKSCYPTEAQLKFWVDRR